MYELQPFPLPTRDELAASARWMGRLASTAGGWTLQTFHALVALPSYLGLRASLGLVGWCGLLLLFAWAEFATVFVLLSAIFALFAFGLGVGDKGELSAYSVFNRGCQAMLGSLNAEQFEAELRHRRPAPVDVPALAPVDEQWVPEEHRPVVALGDARPRRSRKKRDYQARREKRSRRDAAHDEDGEWEVIPQELLQPDDGAGAGEWEEWPQQPPHPEQAVG